MNIKQYKQRKERGCSVSDLAEELKENADNYESIVIIGLTNDKGIDISFSSDNGAESIGLLEVAKSILVDEIRDS